MELFTNEDGEYDELCADVGMKARVDQYYSINNSDSFKTSETYKLNAIYRTVGCLYTTTVVRMWFEYLEKYYTQKLQLVDVDVDVDVETNNLVSPVIGHHIDNGSASTNTVTTTTTIPTTTIIESQAWSWNTPLLRSIEAFRVQYPTRRCVIADIDQEYLYVLKHYRRLNSRNNHKNMSNSESDAVGKDTELLSFSPFHPVKLFVPRHLSSTMVS